MKSIVYKGQKYVAVAESKMDKFIDDAAHAVVKVWQDASNRQMGGLEIDRLNDLLTEFFSDSRYCWFDDKDIEPKLAKAASNIFIVDLPRASVRRDFIAILPTKAGIVSVVDWTSDKPSVKIETTLSEEQLEALFDKSGLDYVGITEG